jgi:hypothetical protein
LSSAPLNAQGKARISMSRASGICRNVTGFRTGTDRAYPCSDQTKPLIRQEATLIRPRATASDAHRTFHRQDNGVQGVLIVSWKTNLQFIRQPVKNSRFARTLFRHSLLTSNISHIQFLSGNFLKLHT